ncbi:MAG TPA: cupin domain-containing protein [Rhizomicrobium sp.]|jgi:quercetin dioxygenase-like cupin family protein|nr:cupin domain-containing protein [Rhizomicrobium sp.]
MRLVALAALLLACGLGSAALAGDMDSTPALEDTHWGPGPANMPPGAQLAVMAGNPAKAAFVSLRLKLPPGYTIPPHTHPTDEHVTVLEGTLAMGMGDVIDPKAEITLGKGGYAVAAAGMHHYARTTGGAIVQVDMMGPATMTYINPADDPRGKK